MALKLTYTAQVDTPEDLRLVLLEDLEARISELAYASRRAKRPTQMLLALNHARVSALREFTEFLEALHLEPKPAPSPQLRVIQNKDQ